MTTNPPKSSTQSKSNNTTSKTNTGGKPQQQQQQSQQQQKQSAPQSQPQPSQQQQQQQPKKPEPVESWDEERLQNALKTIEQLQEQISTLRLLPPSLLQTLSNPSPSPQPMHTGLPSPPRSPPREGVDADPSAPEAMYARFEGLANELSRNVKEMRERWGSEGTKEVLEYVRGRGGAEWDVVVGR